MARRLEITVSDEVWDRLEVVRLHEPRASFVKRALESALGEAGASNAGRGIPSDAPSPRASSRAPVEKEPGLPSDALSTEGPDDRAEIRTPAPSRRALIMGKRFRCRSCDFEAASERARCPRHSGALVPA